jgi:hypothetical protein
MNCRRFRSKRFSTLPVFSLLFYNAVSCTANAIIRMKFCLFIRIFYDAVSASDNTNYSIMLVPSNATQRLYNIQLNLLISQYVSAAFRSSLGGYNCLPNALLNCKSSYFLYGPIFTIIFPVDDNIGIHQCHILNCKILKIEILKFYTY